MEPGAVASAAAADRGLQPVLSDLLASQNDPLSNPRLEALPSSASTDGPLPTEVSGHPGTPPEAFSPASTPAPSAAAADASSAERSDCETARRADRYHGLVDADDTLEDVICESPGRTAHAALFGQALREDATAAGPMTPEAAFAGFGELPTDAEREVKRLLRGLCRDLHDVSGALRTTRAENSQLIRVHNCVFHNLTTL